MEKLLKGTTAYKILRGDRAQGRLSHAYMLHLPDPDNLRFACKLFAAEIYGADGETRRRIMDESFPDVLIFPAPDKKISVDDAERIVGESAVRPVEGDGKVFVVAPFDAASAAVQNKLLKSLEEPPAGVRFLLGAVTTAPVLTTVLSRVKTLDVPPFSEREIYECLERTSPNPANAAAASACGGVLGAAQAMARGDRFKELTAAAEEICLATEGDIGEVCARYGDYKYKNELLERVQALLFAALTGGGDGSRIARRRSKAALIAASENIARTAADVKFNAQFSALLYDFCLRLNEEDSKWKKLSE